MATIILLPLLLIAFTGCKHGRIYYYSDAPPGQVFLSPSSHLETSAFLARWSDSPTEYDKINYLLERVATSEYQFIRNGGTYDGKTARQWLLYKMAHWVHRVETAQDFVSRVASYSQKTGELYLVECPDGKIYTLRSILKNELFHFENQLAELGQHHPEAFSQTGQASLSPTAVATNAASTTS